ncbi:MAG: hypothetical protein LM575_00930 [Caldimicrobium sp.]|nr:hypothetical protein [Caldimicrobium sp.]MCC6025518.1 hypothetical protein [Caldimicrobium sp.]
MEEMEKEKEMKEGEFQNFKKLKKYGIGYYIFQILFWVFMLWFTFMVDIDIEEKVKLGMIFLLGLMFLYYIFSIVLISRAERYGVGLFKFFKDLNKEFKFLIHEDLKKKPNSKNLKKKSNSKNLKKNLKKNLRKNLEKDNKNNLI